MTEYNQGAGFVPPRNNWIYKHYNYQGKPEDPWDPPRQAVVNDANPIPVDVFWSMRSPYSYLALDRLLYLASNYNVDLTIRTVYPVAIRMPSVISGPWYKWGGVITDTYMVSKYEGIPYRWPIPDPIVQDVADYPDCSYAVAPLDQQPYIQQLVRLAAASQLEGNTLAFHHNVHRMLWDGSNDDWRPHLEAAVDRAGMDFKATMKAIEADPEKYDAVAEQNSKNHVMTGHGGVPNMSIRGVGEPFFGQDRILHFFWRLRENGLTTRKESAPPIVARPLHWPDGT